MQSLRNFDKISYYKMEYLQKIILKGSLEHIEVSVSKNGFFTDTNYFDYKALNVALKAKRLDAAALLLSKNCRVNLDSTAPQDTPLHLALKLADIGLIATLLLKNASVVAVNSEGNTALHLAYLSRCDKIVELMLSYVSMLEDSDLINVKSAQGLTHLHIACTIDNIQLVERYIKNGASCNDTVNENSPYCSGYTPLHFATSHNCIKVARFLLENVNVQTKDTDGVSSIQLAYSTSKSSQIIFSHMLEQSDYHKSTLYDHVTHFHAACLGNFSDLVHSFIENGAKINAMLSKESTLYPLYSPLHCAVESQCKDNVELLLQAGANVELRNGQEMTPLHLALYCGNDEIIDLLYKATKDKDKNLVDANRLGYFHVAVTRNDVDLVKVFLEERKEDVNQSVLRNPRNFSGFTPLHFAVKYGHLEMTKLLINNGASVNDNWSDCGAPLHLAFEAGRKDLVDLLLENGAKANTKRIEDGKTMLHLLVQNYIDELEEKSTSNGLLRYIGKMVDMGCDVDDKEMVDGDTALHLACKRFWHGGACAMLLLEMGADVNVENGAGLTAMECALENEYKGNGSDYMALYHHVQQLKALGLPVSPKNEIFCKTVLERRADWEKSTPTNGVNYFSDEELERRNKERHNEQEKLQNVKLDTKISLLGFLSLRSKIAAVYAKNSVLKELLKDKKVKRLYPLYAYLIRLCYWKAVKRFNKKGISRRKTKRSFTGKTGCIGCVGCRGLK